MSILLTVLIAIHTSMPYVSSYSLERNISSHSSQGEISHTKEVTVVIVGPTGSGKSSLANVLLGESPLCTNCTFPVCPGLHSCTKQTSMSSGPWLGKDEIQRVKIVDTPGFGDSDSDDSTLLDEMMTVLKENVGSANIILLMLKGGETRLGRELQQMVREMHALFGDEMWSNLVVGVSFWSYNAELVNFRNSICQFSKNNCRDEEWFTREMSAILKDKFKFQVDMPFVFIDSWAKHPLNIQDENQDKIFKREAEKLLYLAKRIIPFQFRTVNDVLLENHVIKKRNAYLEQTIKADIEKLLEHNKQYNNSLNLFAEHIEKTDINVAQIKNMTEIRMLNIETEATWNKEELKKYTLNEAMFKNNLNKDFNDIKTKHSNQFGNVVKELEFLKINVANEATERRSLLTGWHNMNSKLSVVENKMKNVEVQLGREISDLKKQDNTLRTSNDIKTNQLENEMIKMKGVMQHLPGKWSVGSYCILANGPCPAGFARYQGHLYAIKMYSHLPQWVGAITFGDSFIRCHGTNCKYQNYAELKLISCCK